jgi:deoxyhypusine synthase
MTKQPISSMFQLLLPSENNMDHENIALAIIGATVPSNHPDEHTQSENGELHEFSLPRADGGKDAWLFLAGCFTLEALIWGKVFKYMLSVPV